MPNFFLSHKHVKVAAPMPDPARRQGPAAPAPDLKQTRRDPAQGPPDSTTNLLPGQQRRKLRVGRYRSDWAMKLFTGWVMSAGLVFTAAAANAQVPAPDEIGRPAYVAVSDVGGPYAAMPPEAAVPRY